MLLTFPPFENFSKLGNTLIAAGFDLVSISEAGVIETAQELEPAQVDIIAAIVAVHDPIDRRLSPSLSFLKGDGQNSVLIEIVTDPALDSVLVDINGEPLDVLLYNGRGVIELSSDTPGDTITITSDHIPGQEAVIYVI